MRFLVTMGLAATVIAAAHAQGQPPAPQAPAAAPALQSAPVKGATTGFMHAIHATNNVETTLSFYRDVFGLDTKVQPFANPAVPILTNSPGVSLRIAMLRIPPPGRGLNFELTEFTNTERRPARPNITDPGAPHMKFLVRDVEPVLTAAKKRNAEILSKSGGVVTMPDGVRRMFMRDPDGYLVEAVQVSPEPDAPAGNVIGAIMGLTIANVEESMKFWRDMLGWEFSAPAPWTKVAPVVDLMGLPDGAELRTVRAVVPGSTARIEMLEFRGVKGAPFDLRVPDPGASGMAIRVAGIQELLSKMKAAGVRVISKDQALVEWDAKTRNVFVKDPNGLLIELVGTVAPPEGK
jgi:catechol 2,3-dioxygenase-like lactoylglutathione lyase family enzyme